MNADDNFQPEMPPRRRRISDLRTTPVSTAWRQAGIRCSKTIEHNIRLCTDICEIASHPRWHEGKFCTLRRRTIATTSRRTEQAVVIDTIDRVASNSRALKACQILSEIWSRDETLINDPRRRIRMLLYVTVIVITSIRIRKLELIGCNSIRETRIPLRGDEACVNTPRLALVATRSITEINYGTNEDTNTNRDALDDIHVDV